MKSSITSRSLKLLGLATQLGRKELAQTFKEQLAKGVDEVASGRLKNRIDQARLIAENLSQLKGAAMKAGQLLSLDPGELFPPEAIEILTKLQSQAEPIEWSALEGVLSEDLGQEKMKQFKSLSRTASASASIGQVHRGVLSENFGSQNVAVKIQYPGVAESIDSDLAILRTIAQSFITLSGRKMDVTELFAELATVLHQEADYELERANMIEFRELLAPFAEFIVPKPVSELSSKRVLTMSWENGQSVLSWLKKNPPYAEREQVGRWILDLYCREFFEWGLVQTDPNYGNFLIKTDPLKLVVLDFGATLRYPPEFRRNYITLLNALGTLDRSKIVRAFTDFGFIDGRESDETKQIFADFLLMSVEPFNPRKQPFRFKDEEYARRSREVGQYFTQSLKYSAPPRQILFLHRKLGGIFTMLKRLDVQIDLVPYWENMTKTQIKL